MPELTYPPKASANAGMDDALKCYYHEPHTPVDKLRTRVLYWFSVNWTIRLSC